MEKNKKLVTLGEIMLRLKSPENTRLFQNGLLEATFGGAEANVAVSVSLLGGKASFLTAVPDNPMGRAALAELNRYGVETDGCVLSPDGRLGIYYLEAGSCLRPSVVTYDRSYSAFSLVAPESFSFEDAFSDADWFHVTGITPAVSATAAELALTAVKAAKTAGLTVSVDLNYRKKLWKYGKSAPEVMTELVKYADVVFSNEEDIQLSLGIMPEFKGDYRVLTAEVKKRFPSVKMVAVTRRESFSADKNGWSACLDGAGGFIESNRYLIEDIVDRVGAGDAFTAGMIFALKKDYSEEDALNFAVASSALKHTIPGDFNLSTFKEVSALAAGNSSGRVQR